jgi:hypothetical protein
MNNEISKKSTKKGHPDLSGMVRQTPFGASSDLGSSPTYPEISISHLYSPTLALTEL